MISNKNNLLIMLAVIVLAIVFLSNGDDLNSLDGNGGSLLAQFRFPFSTPLPPSSLPMPTLMPTFIPTIPSPMPTLPSPTPTTPMCFGLDKTSCDLNKSCGWDEVTAEQPFCNYSGAARSCGDFSAEKKCFEYDNCGWHGGDNKCRSKKDLVGNCNAVFLDVGEKRCLSFKDDNGTSDDKDDDFRCHWDSRYGAGGGCSDQPLNEWLCSECDNSSCPLRDDPPCDDDDDCGLGSVCNVVDKKCEPVNCASATAFDDCFDKSCIWDIDGAGGVGQCISVSDFITKGEGEPPINFNAPCGNNADCFGGLSCVNRLCSGAL